MRKEEQVRWDVTVPDGGKSRKESRWKTVLSALVLLALLAGPILISGGRKRSNGDLPANSGLESVTALSAAATTDAETGAAGGACTSKEAADSAGTHYERYFPGRQTM